MNNEDNATVINPAHGEYGAAEQDATDPNANEERYVEDESLKGLKRDVVKEMLVESLAQTEAPGSFAAFYALADFVNPILMIDNDGPPIRLPLQETDAARIIAASHKAPFGQGSETIVDESVRKTYELNRDQFSILDSGFPRVVFNCVQGAANLLGIMPNQGEIRAELYKLLLYEKGAHFRPHTDTIKTPGMFGTMVICLPSAHEGGDIILRHNGAEQRFSTAMFQPTAACWYSDVTHEVLEVTSGYRLVLTFNLVQSPNVPYALSAASHDVQNFGLERALKAWMYYVRDQTAISSRAHELVYVLDHKYTESSLGVASLKGADKARMAALRHFSKLYNYEIFLANMEHYITGEPENAYDPYDHYGGRGGYWDDDDDDDEDEDDDDPDRYEPIADVIENETKLKRMVSLDGELVLTDVRIDVGGVIPEDAFERMPDQHEYRGYTGNAGAESAHWYRDTVIVLVHRPFLSDFLVGAQRTSYPKKDVSPVLDWLIRGIESPTMEPHIKEALSKTCGYIVEANTRSLQARRAASRSSPIGGNPFSDAILGRAVIIMAKLKLVGMIPPALCCAENELPPEAHEAIGSLLTELSAVGIQKLIDTAVDCCAGLGQKHTVLTRVFGKDFFNKTDPAAIYAIDALTRSIDSCKTSSSADCRALAEVALALKSEQFVEEAMEVLLSDTTQTSPLLAFLATWLKGAGGRFSRDFAKIVFRKIFSPMTVHFSLEAALSNSRKKTKIADGNTAGASNEFGPLVGDLSVLTTCLVRSHMGIAVKILHSSVECVLDHQRSEMYRAVSIPYLTRIQKLAMRSSGGCLEEFQRMYCTTLEGYLKRFVQRQPPAFQNWARNRVTCSCGDCWRLNLFLVSATQQVARFPVSKNKRHHLHSVLDINRVDCTHITERIIPETLVVTKRDKGKAAYDAWLSRCKEAHEALQRFDQDALRNLLGDQQYEAIVGMHCIIMDEANAPAFLPRVAPLRETQQKARTSAQGPAQAGVKRKAEVIDLCDSD